MAMRQTPLTCSGHTRPVVDLAFSGITPYGYFLISACKDGKPMLRQGDTGDWIGTFLGHKGAVWGATLNADATKAATAAADFTAERELQPLIQPGSPSHHSHLNLMEKAYVNEKALLLWDSRSMEEVKTLMFETSVSSMEYVADGEILVITYGKTVAFYNALSLDLIKTVEAPAPINSASLHPDKDFFVAGGEDFKLYKFDYGTKEELESYKGHFGPVHCVRFSPDGELYASGSEDGTLRLWQTAVGKTYGLWKCVLPEDLGTENSEQLYSTTPEIKA
uniref:Serine-threonine kinase receptor-associated protein n=1 Tax=Cyprinodon variegatus TaxID=28743 RepID=A0A3Q2DG31_CYPVA